MQMRIWVLLLIPVKRYVGSLLSFCVLLLLSSHNVFALPNVGSDPIGVLSNKNVLALQTAQQKIIDKDYQQALNLSNRILTEMPTQFEAQFIRAQALSRLGKTKMAIELYQSILKSNSMQPEIYNNLAILYVRQGNLDLARQTLNNGLATSTQYKTLYDNLSAIYVEMARGAYSKALKLGVKVRKVQLKALNVAYQLPVHKQTQASDLAVASVQKKLSSVNKNSMADKVSSVKNPIVKALAQKNNVVAVITQQVKIKKTPVNKHPVVNMAKDEVITALQGWAAAWSAQAVDLYLSFYDEKFKPVKLSKKIWVVQRRIRIRKPRWVNVRLNNFEVRPLQKDKAIVRLVQDYRADNYSDKTRKQFLMQRTVDGWRILSEKNLAVIK